MLFIEHEQYSRNIYSSLIGQNHTNIQSIFNIYVLFAFKRTSFLLDLFFNGSILTIRERSLRDPFDWINFRYFLLGHRLQIKSLARMKLNQHYTNHWRTLWTKVMTCHELATNLILYLPYKYYAHDKNVYVMCEQWKFNIRTRLVFSRIKNEKSLITFEVLKKCWIMY